MIDFSIASTILLVWGLVMHFVADWLTQNEWVALNKMFRRTPTSSVFDRHPSAYVHAGIHTAVQMIVFPWPVALAIGFAHLLIDTREPVIGWSKVIHQTTPEEQDVPQDCLSIAQAITIAADQVWHMAVIAIAALLVG